MTFPRTDKLQAPIRVAVDTGGTFTDCVWLERGKLRMAKVFSTPQDPSAAIVQALSALPASADLTLLHGTTVGTNTLLQRKGARVAFVTTAGFEDIIEIGRQSRPKLYDLTFQRVRPLVTRDMRFGIPERVDSNGRILLKPLRDDLRMLARDIHASNAEAIAVSTLFSFANPQNEQAIGRLLEELGLPISVSHVILPEFREYERASTVVINAYLQPVMQSYLQLLDLKLRQNSSAKIKASRVFVMQSSGGIASLEASSKQPVRTVLSGPAGGVVGAAAMARHSGITRMITFDMGGTSTDVALIDEELKPSTEGEIDGLPIRVPMLDIHTVGAGGGSLVCFDAGGAMRVGPESAGADPGPICYGRGLRPTVTDANLLLGRLQADQFLGGSFLLDLERTRSITADWLKQQQSRMSLEQFAEGVIRVVNANMERALRLVSVERGYDPRDFSLVVFGGAGGLHACELAQSLGIPRVVIPAFPGALSAFGILASDIVKDHSRTVMLIVDAKAQLPDLIRQYERLERDATREFHDEGWTGKPIFHRSADLRYKGQGFELNVPFSRSLLAHFHRQHKFRYGYDHVDREVEVVTVRLRARLTSARIPEAALHAPAARTRVDEKRRVWFAGKELSATMYHRHEIGQHHRGGGPAIITEYSATTFLPPKFTFAIHRAGNLLVRLPGKKKAPN